MRRCGGISLTANFSSPPSFLLQYICMEGRIFLTIFFFSADRYYLYPILGQQQFSGTNLAACILHGKSIHSQYIYLTEFPLLLLLCVDETYMQKYFFSPLFKVYYRYMHSYTFSSSNLPLKTRVASPLFFHPLCKWKMQ